MRENSRCLLLKDFSFFISSPLSSMETVYGEEQMKCSNKIDLTLKLSPCGDEKEEERRRKLKRSLSVMNDGSITFLPCLNRSSSLPSEAEDGNGKRMLHERLRRIAVAVNGANFFQVKSLLNPSGNSNHMQDAHKAQSSSAKGPNLNNNASTTKTNDSMASNKTTNINAKAVDLIDLNTQASTTEQNNSLAYKKTTTTDAKEAEGLDLDTNASTTKKNDCLTSKKKINTDSKEKIPDKRFKLGNYCSLKGDVMEILRQIPSVTTTGDGPNGRRVEGFLYKYRNRQACIVCVCHGNFLTPAEFVMHAGGKEVENPMKQITVYFSPF
ncbi:uncharacterized protein [Arachis hypogaea]